MDLLTLAILVLLSALISGVEIGFFSVNDTRLRALAEAGGRRAALALRLRGNPQRLLLTLEFADNLVNVWAATVTAIITVNFFNSEALAVTTGVLTVVLMIYADVVPKSLAARHAVPLVLASAYPVFWLEQLLLPIRFILEPLVRWHTGGKGMTAPYVTEEELKIMLDEGGRAGSIETEEVKMIKNVFQLNDITAEDAMTPRLYVFALDGKLLLKDVQAKLFESKFSRIPVYDGTLDNVTGILSKTKALMELAQGRDNQRLKDIAQPAPFVPATKPADDLMKQFRQEHRHMAVVVNEFGGMMGIVTLEDLLEEVVGEIMDETDITEELIKRVGKNHILVHGRTEVRRINEFFKTEFEDESNTVSGLIQQKLGHIPAVGEEIRIGQCRLVVHEADAKSIKSVQMFKDEKAGTPSEPHGERQPDDSKHAVTHRSFLF
jgi:magnesium and cobalt exporter, CNNM family